MNSQRFYSWLAVVRFEGFEMCRNVVGDCAGGRPCDLFLIDEYELEREARHERFMVEHMYGCEGYLVVW